MAEKNELPELNLEDKPLEAVDVIIDDTAPAVVVEGAEQAPAAKEGDDVDAAVKALQEQLASSDAARLAEAARANQAEQKVSRVESDLKTFRSSAHESQYNLVVGQIEALNEKASNVERDLAEAHSVGDYAKVAKVQREMSRLEAQIQRLEDGKSDLEARKTDAADDAAPVKSAGSLDPVGAFIDSLQVSPKDKAWMRNHPDAVTDQAKFNKLTSAANYAANIEGLPPDSDEFYAFIEQKLGYTQAAPKPDVTAERREQQPAQRKQPAFAAPVSREAMPLNGQSKKTGKIHLSPAQVDAAATAGLTQVEYAKNLVKQVEEGQLDARLIQYVN